MAYMLQGSNFNDLPFRACLAWNVMAPQIAYHV